MSTEAEQSDPFAAPARELIAEKDAFRLTVRAHAEIEQLVLMALQSVFVDSKLPDDLKHIGFARSLSLAIALGLIPPELKQVVKSLTDLRNEFAHAGGPNELSAARAKELIRPIRPLLPDKIIQELKGKSPLFYLRVAVFVIYVELARAIRLATAERDFAEQAVAEVRAKPILTVEEITELLAQGDSLAWIHRGGGWGHLKPSRLVRV